MGGEVGGVANGSQRRADRMGGLAKLREKSNPQTPTPKPHPLYRWVRMLALPPTAPTP